MRVWSTGDAAVTVALSVVPATVEDGVASLDGDPEPVGWVTLSDERITLEPGEERSVDLIVEGPRRLDDTPRTVAVLAQAAADPGADEPAVVERLALVAYLRPQAGGPPSLGLLPWLAGALALGIAVWAVLAARRRRTEAEPATAH